MLPDVLLVLDPLTVKIEPRESNRVILVPGCSAVVQQGKYLDGTMALTSTGGLPASTC